MYSKISTIVFDLGGVLVDWNPRYVYRQLIPNESMLEHFMTHVCNLAWNEQMDAGRPFIEATSELIREFPEHEHLIRAYHERWSEMIRDQIHGTVQILEELHRGGRHRLFALSNWSAETFPYARARFPFFQYFEKVLLSGEEKMIKPDPRFFALLSERYGVTPREALFIDDLHRNIAAAESLGFQTVHFKNPESLRDDLKRLGVLNEK